MFSFDFSETPVTLYLLIINLIVSGYVFFFDDRLMERMWFKIDRILAHKEYYRLITAGFVHGGLAHLAFNMITLYFFGQFMEMLLGPVRFLALYFGAELAAHGLTLLWHRDDPEYAAVGASGAISGVVFAFCMFRPFEPIYLFFAIGIPAILFAVGYVGFSIYAMKQQQGMRGGIAHEAHLGGALGGVVMTSILEPRAIQILLGHFGL